MTNSTPIVVNRPVAKTPELTPTQQAYYKKMKILRHYLLTGMHNPKSLLSLAMYDTSTPMFESPKLSSGDFVSPIKLLGILNKKYGEEWLGYDTHAFLAEEYSERELDKIMALKCLFVKDDFFNKPYVFEKTVLAFNDAPVSPGVYQDVDACYIAYALCVAHVLRPGAIMSNSVQEYIVAQLLDDGYSVFLYPFDFETSGMPDEVKRVTSRIKSMILKDDIKGSESLLDQFSKYSGVIEYLIDKGIIKEKA